MTLRLVNTFEGGTNGVRPVAGAGNGSGQLNGNDLDGVIGASGTVLYDTAQFKHGAKSLKIQPNGTGSTGVFWDQTSISVSPLTAYVRFYFRLSALPASAAKWLTFANAGAASQLAAISLRTDGKLDLLDTGGTVRATSSTTLSTGQWYRLEAKVFSDPLAGTFDVRLFTGANVEGTSPDETISFANQDTDGTHARFVQFGPFNTVSSLAYWIDSIEYSDIDWPGPFTPPVPSPYETLFASNTTYPFMVPVLMDNVDTGTYTFGMLFHATVDGKVYGAAWANGTPATSAENGLTPQIALYAGSNSTPLASKTTTVTEKRANWNYELFTTPVSITANNDYVIAVFRKGYSHESYFFDSSNGGHGIWTNAHLVATDVTTSDNNFFDTSGSLTNPFGVASFHSTWYGIDVLFQPNAGGGTQGHWGIPLA